MLRNAKMRVFSKEKELYTVQGIDFGVKLKRIAASPTHNIYRIPGHTGWVDRMTGSTYSPTQYIIEEIETGKLSLLNSVKVIKEEKE